MQIPYKNLGRSSIVLETQGILSEKLKLLTSSKYHRIFHIFPTYQCLLKNVRDFFVGVFFI